MTPPGSRFKFTCILVAQMLAVWAAVASLRQAWAEQMASTQPAAAIGLDPSRADFYLFLADTHERAGQDALKPLTTALVLRPADADIRIRLGLTEEANGDLSRAEHHLLEAAKLSRKYEPCWVLANYYYRRNHLGSFWWWARKALERSYGNRTSLFELCWRVAPKGDLLLQELAPGRREDKLALASFLLNRQLSHSVESLLKELSLEALASEKALFLESCEQLLSAGRVSASLDVWNHFCASSGLCEQLDGASGSLLPKSVALSPRTLQGGFDWRLPEVPGLTVRPGSPSEGWTIALEGNQPEQFEALWRHLPATGGRAYRVHFDYGVSTAPGADPAQATGLKWQVVLLDGRMLDESEYFVSVPRTSSAFTFAAPGGTNGIRLILKHERQAGWVRFRGSVNLTMLEVHVEQ